MYSRETNHWTTIFTKHHYVANNLMAACYKPCAPFDENRARENIQSTTTCDGWVGAAVVANH